MAGHARPSRAARTAATASGGPTTVASEPAAQASETSWSREPGGHGELRRRSRDRCPPPTTASCRSDAARPGQRPDLGTDVLVAARADGVGAHVEALGRTDGVLGRHHGDRADDAGQPEGALGAAVVVVRHEEPVAAGRPQAPRASPCGRPAASSAGVRYGKVTTRCWRTALISGSRAPSAAVSCNGAAQSGRRPLGVVGALQLAQGRARPRARPRPGPRPAQRRRRRRARRR